MTNRENAHLLQMEGEVEEHREDSLHKRIDSCSYAAEWCVPGSTLPYV